MGDNEDDSWYGGGVFTTPRTLALNYWSIAEGNTPFETATPPQLYGGEDLNVLYQRLARAGVVEKDTFRETNKVKLEGATPQLAFRLDLNDLSPPE